MAKKQTPVRFASGPDAPRETLDLYLPRPEPLTRAEAERLIGVVKNALVTRDTAAVEELSLYTDRGREALYTTLGELQRRIRTVLTTTLTSERGGRYVYVLSGQREPPVTVTIEQDVRTKIFFE
jgi:chromosome condensin MukBEF complex kleisin-like MukF subunit